MFGLKTSLHAYVSGEHTSMKNELSKTNNKSQGVIFRAPFQCSKIINLYNHSIIIMYNARAWK